MSHMRYESSLWDRDAVLESNRFIRKSPECHLANTQSNKHRDNIRCRERPKQSKIQRIHQKVKMEGKQSFLT